MIRYKKEDFLKICSIDNVPNIKARQTNLSSANNDNFLNFISYSRSLQISSDRNNTVVLIARHGLGLDIDKVEIEQEIKRFCAESGLPESEGLNVFNYQKKYHSEKAFSPVKKQSDKNQTEGSTSSLILAKQIINDSVDPITGEVAYICIKDNLYEYTDYKYSAVDENVFELRIRKKLNDLNQSKVNQNKIRETVQNIKSETFYIGNETNNFFIHDKTDDKFLNLNGNVINLTKAISGTIEVFPASPKYFCLSVLPYNYNQNCKCDEFMNILKRVLPSELDQKMLQSWFGYHLIGSVNFGKMLVFIGSGANGKSVILKVLRLFLGAENVSSVAIENFNNKRTFPIAETHGKLGNICDEMSDGQIDEAMLKSYITGSVIQVERKYGTPFSFTPTAKLTFATNTMPTIRDRSDGIWRRLSILNFNEKISPNEQNPKYTDDKFWIESGELPGVFNWALDGAREIIKSNEIYQSPSSREYSKKVKVESNSARQWISENIVYEKNEFLSRDCYENYRDEMTCQSMKPNSKNDFFDEIRKAFPKALEKENAVKVNEQERKRGWVNIRLTQETQSNINSKIFNSEITNE